MQKKHQSVQVNVSPIPKPLNALHSLQANGGQFTVFSCFGDDPLKCHPELIEEREHSFYNRYVDYISEGSVSISTVSGNFS